MNKYYVIMISGFFLLGITAWGCSSLMSQLSKEQVDLDIHADVKPAKD